MINEILMDEILRLAIIAAIFIVYFLPWIIAARRDTKMRSVVAILNLFLGWTILFWFLALALALEGKKHCHEGCAHR